MPLLCLGLNHRTAPLVLRERLAYTPPALEAALVRFSRETPRGKHSPERVILSTCNRVELYAFVPAANAPEADPFDGLMAELVTAHGVAEAALAPHLYRWTSNQAVRHLCRVAAGLDSMVLGEPQILGQVADALAQARKHQAAGTVMTALFRAAIRAGRRARHETKLNRKPASIPSVAVRLARQVVGRLEAGCVAVVGGGKVGTLALQALREHTDCTLAVVNRTWEVAQEQARHWGAAAYCLAQLPEVLAGADVVITSAASEEPFVTGSMVQEAMRGRLERPLTLIDVAVPRNVEAAVAGLDHVHLFDLDSLQATAREVVAERRREVPHVEHIIEEETQAFEEWQRGADVMPLIADLRHKAEFIRRQELQRMLEYLPDLDPATRAHVERLSFALVNKLLHEPTTRLRIAAQAGHAAESAETVRRLFALRPGDVHAA